MNNNDQSIKVIGNTEVTELDRIQYQQAGEFFRSQNTLMMQVITAIIITNASIVTYALSEERYGLIFICGFFPLIAFFIIMRTIQYLIPLMITMKSIEEREQPSLTKGLIQTWMQYVIHDEIIRKIQRNEKRIGVTLSEISKDKNQIFVWLIAIASFFQFLIGGLYLLDNHSSIDIPLLIII